MSNKPKLVTVPTIAYSQALRLLDPCPMPRLGRDGQNNIGVPGSDYIDWTIDIPELFIKQLIDMLQSFEPEGDPSVGIPTNYELLEVIYILQIALDGKAICTNCLGEGIVTYREYPGAALQTAFDYKDCATCKGTGVIDIEEWLKAKQSTYNKEDN